MKTILLLVLSIFSFYSLLSQRLENRLKNTCENYYFNKERLSFKPEVDREFYVESVEEVTGLDSLRVKFGNCSETARLNFYSSSHQEIEDFLVSEFPSEGSQFPVTVRMNFEL